MTPPTKLCLFYLATLNVPLTLGNGTVLPAGAEVMLLPQTTAASVAMGNGNTLAEVWPNVSVALAGYAGELVRYADRLTTVEAKLERMAGWAKQNGYAGE